MVISFSHIANAQPWLKNLPHGKQKDALTFFDYQKAFNDYWTPYNVKNGFYFKNGVKKKAIGWKHFKRWEYYMESQVNPVSGEFPKKSVQQVYTDYLSSNPQPPSEQSSANWVSLGTTNSDGGYAGIGRVSCIAFHPTNPNTYWVGVGAGGLWVTTNNGSTWTCLTDNNGVLAVSDIAIPSDYATSNTIYIATGDRDSWDNNSIGVLKSTDGGLTWNTTGLTFPVSSYKLISKLLIDPSNNQIIIASTTDGVYKTTDGGATWNTQLTSAYFIDMEYMPGNFSTLYGSTQNGEIYVSANSGLTWTSAFSDANATRIELAVSANQPGWVYAVAAASDDGLYGIFKSTDNGVSYNMVFDGTTSNMLGYEEDGTGTGGQGWYDLTIAASPSNANILFIGGVNTWASNDAGVSWTIKNHWVGNNAQAVHADKHFLKFHSNGNLFECNDGGIYVTTDNGTTWTDKTNGLVISQMYKLGISATNTTETITGLQDNGSKLLYGGTWFDVKGGDGMECLIDYIDANVQYATYVNGQITRTTDHWLSDYTDVEPAGAGSGAWVTPYIIDPVNNQTLYAGYADVWKTTDRGNNWTQISTINSSAKIRSMAVAPSDNQVLYVADHDTIWKTTDGGANWTDVTGTLPVSTSNITSIAIKNDDDNTIWVTMSGYNANRVYESTNAGSFWTNISAGLPQLPAYSIVQNKQSNAEVHLYLGTEVGVYFKQGTNNWVSYNTNLPNVKIGELEIYYSATPEATKLRAATFGRGLWETPAYYNSGPMTYVSSTTTQNDTSAISPGQTNRKIIGIEIVNTGSTSPLNVTSFTFNTAGSTNPATDITNAKLFYTGLNSSFSTTTPFGTTINTPNGTFSISGNQVLNDGINYFWLTYDVPSIATMDNYLDAQCTSFTMNGIKIPADTNPSGNRQIAVAYCSGASNQCDEHISNVTVGTINNSSTCSLGGYADYTSMNTNIQPGDSLSITVTNGSSTYPQDQCGIWVDWNNNGDFTDDQAIAVTGSPGIGPYTAIIACPLNTLIGLKRMRVRIHYNEETTAPCGSAAWGEVEDYRINIVVSTLPPVAGTAASSIQICAGNNATLTLTGYTGSVQWQQSPNGSIGWVNVTGGNGATTANYSTANLITTTYYRAQVTQIGYPAVYSNTITITVNALPTTTVSANGSTLSVSQSGATYQWIDCGNSNTLISGATNQNYTATVNGNYAVIVTKNGCSDTSLCASVTSIGVGEIKNTTDFNVYPSPATDMITITVGAAFIAKNYSITDEAGKTVLSGKLINEKSVIRLNELAAGVYIIKIMNQNKKIIKK